MASASGSPPLDVDAYVAALSPGLRPRACELCAAIRAALPDADEVIAYGMPAWRIGGHRILHAAVWKKHVGLYPVYRGPEDFEALVGPYRAQKDAVRFLHARPLPADLVTRIALAQRARHHTPLGSHS